MVVYRITDRISVKISGVTFWVSPLTWLQKSQVLSLFQIKAGTEHYEPMKAAMTTIKLSLKAVDGLQYADGTEFHLETLEDGTVSDESLSEIAQLDGIEKLFTVCSGFALRDIKDPKLDGVEVSFDKVKNIKKKPSALSAAS